MSQTDPASVRAASAAGARAQDRPATALRRSRLRALRRANWAGWLMVAPALLVYVIFVLQPLVITVQYSLYRWDGIGASQWVGLQNYVTVLTDQNFIQILTNAFQLILFFCVISVGLGLVVASLIRRVVTGRVGTAARTVLFLPQVIPLVAAGIAWSWVLALSGVVNQILGAIGLGGITQAWLGDFGTALPAVGLIGVWVLLGLCTVLLLTGMGKIDPALYESARIDGAGPVQEFWSITVPSLRNEIAVCITVTAIAALASFDIVYISTGGGPGLATMVPGLEIYQLAFVGQQVGLASALAVVLVLLVLIVVLPIQRMTGGEPL